MGKPKYKPVCLTNGDRVTIANAKTLLDKIIADKGPGFVEDALGGEEKANEFSSALDDLLVRANPVPYHPTPRNRGPVPAEDVEITEAECEEAQEDIGPTTPPTEA